MNQFKSSIGVCSRRKLRAQASPWVLAALVAPMLAFGDPAAAQTAPSGAQTAKTSSLEEIVVTARRVRERLQDVPQAVTALSPTTLRDNHIEAILDIAGIVPNLYTGHTSTVGGGLIFLRGVPAQDLPNATLDSRVAVYVDGVYMARFEGINSAKPDLAGVEVDKGPQGTLFGRNATAGAIAFTTAGPTGQYGGELSASYGNFDAQRYKVTINTPEFHGLSTRFTYNHDQIGGDVKNLAGGQIDGLAQNATIGYTQGSRPTMKALGGHNNDAFFFAARYTGINKLTVDYKFDYTDNREVPQEIQTTGIFPSSTGCEISGYFLGLSIDHCLGGGFSNSFTGNSPTIGALGSTTAGVTGGAPYTANSLSLTKLGTKNLDFSGGAIIRSVGHNLTSQYELTDDLKLKNIIAYRELTANGQFDTDGENYQANPAYFNAIFGSPHNVAAGESLCGSCSYNRQASREFSEEFQIIGKWGQFANFLVGAYYFNEHTQGESYYLFNATPNFTYFGQAIPPLARGAPVFLNLGGFVNGEDEHYQAKSYAGYGHADLHLTSQLDLSVGLRYTIDDKADEVPQAIVTGLLAQLQKSFGTHPTLNSSRLNYDATLKYKVTPDINVYDRYATAYLAGGFFNSTEYKPEDTWSDELGVKSEWLDHRLRVNGDVFYQSTDNSQDTGQTPAGGIYVRNIPGTTVNAGFELDTSFVPMTGLTLNGSMGYTHVRYADGRQNPAPEWTAELSGQYDAPHFDNGMYVSFKADADYQSKTYNLQFSALDPVKGGYTDYFTAAYAAAYALANPGLTVASPGTPASNYAHLLTYLGYPATSAGELQYVTALNKETEGGDYWLTNLRLSLVDVPMGANKGRVSAYVKNVFNVRAGTNGSNYGGYFGGSFEWDRTFGVDLSLKF